MLFIKTISLILVWHISDNDLFHDLFPIIFFMLEIVLRSASFNVKNTTNAQQFVT